MQLLLKAKNLEGVRVRVKNRVAPKSNLHIHPHPHPQDSKNIIEKSS